MNANHKNAGQPVLIVFIVMMEDAPVHTNEHPYCDDRLCPCHDEEMEEARGYAPEFNIYDVQGHFVKAYAPNGSNYHDHLCRCPGCDYDGPEPTTDEEIAAIMAEPSPLDADYRRSFFDGLDLDDLDDHPF